MKISKKVINKYLQLANQYKQYIVTPRKSFDELILFFEDNYVCNKLELNPSSLDVYKKVVVFTDLDHSLAAADSMNQKLDKTNIRIYEVLDYDYRGKEFIKPVLKDNVYVVFDLASEKLYSNSSFMFLELSIVRGVDDKDLIFPDLTVTGCDYLSCIRFYFELYSDEWNLTNKARLELLLSHIEHSSAATCIKMLNNNN